MSEQVMEPPWERFPEYERYTIGWRMGPGEEWLWAWQERMEGLGSYDERIAYLRRHRPAPGPWADFVYETLHPDWRAGADDYVDVTEAQRAELAQLGLIRSDVAYDNWLARQPALVWPWTLGGDTPEEAAQYNTRAFWFVSRQLADARRTGAIALPEMPAAWRPLRDALLRGEVKQPPSQKGLLCLALGLAAGRVLLPWELGLSPAMFEDSFDAPMGYVDAFRLWAQSVLDDDAQAERLLAAMAPPPSWADWLARHFVVYRLPDVG